jgi:hypothetical protein
LAGNRHVLQVAESFDVTQAADEIVGAGHLEHASADLIVAVANLVDDGLERDVQGKQPIRIELDLVLPDEPILATSATPGTVSS